MAVKKMPFWMWQYGYKSSCVAFFVVLAWGGHVAELEKFSSEVYQRSAFRFFPFFLETKCSTFHNSLEHQQALFCWECPLFLSDHFHINFKCWYSILELSPTLLILLINSDCLYGFTPVWNLSTLTVICCRIDIFLALTSQLVTFYNVFKFARQKSVTFSPFCSSPKQISIDYACRS